MNRILISLFSIPILLLWVIDISILWDSKLEFHDIQVFAEVPVSDSDGDGVEDTLDLCVLVKWTVANHGCPELHVTDFSSILSARLSGNNLISGTASDRDGDGVADTRDLCPTIVGTLVYEWCPWASLLSGLGENQCLSDQLWTRGLMVATPVCLVCPCDNTIEMRSLVRTCDVLFPAILSKDQKTVYSRWSFFLVH